jgi:prolyl 4-hydroxylase
MVSIEDSGLRGGGRTLKQSIWDAARDTIQEWTGQELTPASMYGIRVYTGGALLAPHVDRLPLVSSAIVNVAQDVDEPWPLEVIGRDGIAYNVTMEPGDMVLYESHSCLHARPFPMKGRYFANIFIHFEPVGHSLRHNYQYDDVDVHKKYSTSISRRQVGHEAEQSGLPPYIMDGSEEAKRWRRSHPNDQPSSRVSSFTTGSTSAHMAAQDGDIETLMEIVDKRGHLVNAKDENGWTPLHEGARGGHVDVIELLVSRGAEINERTNHGSGSSALYIAKENHDVSHPVVKFLESIGALSIGPEL